MKDTIGIFARLLITFGLGGLVANGWITQDDLEKIISYTIGLMGIGGMAIWTLMRNRLTSVLDRAAKDPKVEVIVTDPKTAAATESMKVVANDPRRDSESRK